MILIERIIRPWCARYEPSGNQIPKKYLNHSLWLIISIRVVCLVGFFLTGANIWTWMIWWPIIFAFNTEDFEKVYMEYWEIRIKTKPTLSQALTRYVELWSQQKAEEIRNRNKKK